MRWANDPLAPFSPGRCPRQARPEQGALRRAGRCAGGDAAAGMEAGWGELDESEIEMDDTLTDEELAELERLEQAATAGPWYPHATDDEVFMNARYVSTEPGPTMRRVKLSDGEHVIDVGKWTHDGAQGMADGNKDQAQSDKVVAVTLLQAPRLADPDQCDENTELIAALRNAAPRLLAELAELRAENARLRGERDAALSAAPAAPAGDVPALKGGRDERG